MNDMNDGDEMRAAFWAWVDEQGCDTDGAWSAWAACWDLLKEERERCARICESVNNHDNPMTARDCADAIRAGVSGVNCSEQEIRDAIGEVIARVVHRAVASKTQTKS